MDTTFSSTGKTLVNHSGKNNPEVRASQIWNALVQQTSYAEYDDTTVEILIREYQRLSPAFNQVPPVSY